MPTQQGFNRRASKNAQQAQVFIIQSVYTFESAWATSGISSLGIQAANMLSPASAPHPAGPAEQCAAPTVQESRLTELMRSTVVQPATCSLANHPPEHSCRHPQPGRRCSPREYHGGAALAAAVFLGRAWCSRPPVLATGCRCLQGGRMGTTAGSRGRGKGTASAQPHPASWAEASPALIMLRL